MLLRSLRHAGCVLHDAYLNVVFAKLELCSLEENIFVLNCSIFLKKNTCNSTHVSMVVVDGPTIQGKADILRLFILDVFLDSCFALVIYLQDNAR